MRYDSVQNAEFHLFCSENRNFLKKSYRGVISFSNLYVFNETIDTMIDHSDKKLDYALRAIQHPQLRETDEFLQWIGIPENKELFLELMACKEAVIRENLQRKRKYRKKMRILAIASSAAAVLILAFLIPSLLPSTSLPAEQPIRFLLRTTMMNMWSYKWMVVVNSSY